MFGLCSHLDSAPMNHTDRRVSPAPGGHTGSWHGPSNMRKELLLFLSNRPFDASLINSLSISGGGMSGSQENEDEAWWRPSWATDDTVEPPGPPRPRQPAVEPDYTHPLPTPLAHACRTPSPGLRHARKLPRQPWPEGLRVRMSTAKRRAGPSMRIPDPSAGSGAARRRP